MPAVPPERRQKRVLPARVHAHLAHRGVPPLEPYEAARLIATNRIRAVLHWLGSRDSAARRHIYYLHEDLVAELTSQGARAISEAKPADIERIRKLREAVELIDLDSSPPWSEWVRVAESFGLNLFV